VQSIERKDATLSFHFHPGAGVDPARLMTFISRHPDAQFTPSGVLRVPVRDSSQNVVTQATAILQQLQAT
jgi:hypothetical protein